MSKFTKNLLSDAPWNTWGKYSYIPLDFEDVSPDNTETGFVCRKNSGYTFSIKQQICVLKRKILENKARTQLQNLTPAILHWLVSADINMKAGISILS